MKPSRRLIPAILGTFVALLATAAQTTAAPALVQQTSKEIASGTTNSLAFASNNTAGNLIVAYVVWNNQGDVTVSDSRGNPYTSAVGPTLWSGCCRAQVFYARNIAGGANTVTTTFQTAVTQFGVLYVLEYSGIDPTVPVDVVAAAAGTGSAMNSGSATTTNAADLIFGAAVSSAAVTAVGTGFTSRTFQFGNLVEDKNVTTTGSYNATATQNGASWAMQMVAFRAAGGSSPPPPPSFDFTVSNGGNKSVARGSSVQNAIALTLSTGTGQAVSFSASGLPAGASASFSPNPCTPTCATTMTVTTTASTPLATSTVTVTANGGGVSHTTSFSLTVTAAPDTVLPTVSISSPTSGTVMIGTKTVSATASDNVGVVGVQFLLDGANLNAEDTTSPYSASWVTTNASDGAHVLSARVRDAAGNLGLAANVNVVVDNHPPTGSVVINGGAAFTNNRTATLTLSATDALTGVTQMRFSNTGSSYSTAEAYATTKSWTLATGAGLKTVYVQYKDGAGNWSAGSTATITYDATVPAISGVSPSNVTNQSATINWTTDEPATSQVEFGTTTAYGQTTPIDGNLVTAHSVVLPGLASQTKYNYRARSKDAAGNEKLGSNNTFTTLSGPDTTPPSVPSNLTATPVSPSQINVSWTASTDNVGVTGYTVSRDGNVVATPATTSFADTGLAPGTTHGYTVSARDAAGNTSALTGVVNAATPAFGLSNVQVSSITTTSAVIAWTTDQTTDSQVDYGLTTSYTATTTLDSTLTLNHAQTLTGLTQNTLYHFRVRSRDTGGNVVVSSDFVFTTNSAGAGGTFQNEILITNLSLPTGIKFMPDGDMAITELGGKIWIVHSGQTQVDPTPLLSLTNIGSLNGQQGLLDVVFDPNFETNHYYYVFYTLGTPNRDRASRFTATADHSSTVPGSEVVIFQDDVDANAEHHGGALNFGSDGKLYITTGDHFSPSGSQSLTSYHWKVLRYNTDGTIPTDNPFYDGAGPNYDAIWAMGLRNPFRAQVDPVSGRIFIGDVGQDTWEEINVVARGANFGWPVCEGVCNTPPYVDPIYAYNHNGRDASITGGFVYHGSQFPAAYQGNYFFADYTQNWIRRMTFDANGNPASVLNFIPPDGSADGPYGDIVALAGGPDGALYYADLGYAETGGGDGIGKIRRVRFISNNQPPVAVSAATPTEGPAPLSVSFSSAGSSDPEGDALSFSWDFGDGTSSNEANPLHTYVKTGQYTVRLTVSDGNTQSLANPLTIVVGNRPTVNILTPANGILFRGGDVIEYSGDATDVEDGVLPPSAFTWNIDFHHATHIHPALPTTGTKSGTFTIPVTGHDFSGTTYYEIRLTVTDSDGLQTSKSVFIMPDKVNLTFDTVPSGLKINLDGIPHTTPFVYDTLINFNHTIEAPDQSDQNTYTFVSWSDGGAQQHLITVPPVAAGYVATYNVVQNPSLVAAYGFNEGAGSVLTDRTGKNNGTISGAKWVPGRYGSALSFNGTSDIVNITESPSLHLTTAFTLEAWVNPAALSGWQDVIYKGNDNYFLDTSGASAAGGASTTSSSSAIGGGGLAVNTWSHVAVTYDGTTLRIYVNGVLANSAAVTGALASSNYPLTIGGDTLYAQYFRGIIDEVRIYNRALTQTEIQTDMNTPL